ncbi:3-hydroxyisobutyryl-coenzyme A hydrolase [Hysterangium stoloniferum]|nr:3-hydroxyisobutyryl-coenzyme A hydrolase [Hysterangium stoloniferum]
MSRRILQQSTMTSRTSMISRHVSAAAGGGQGAEEPLVLSESNLATRTYILNRPAKYNALDDTMVNLVKSKVETWDAASLCQVIIGTGRGRAFCAGGDIFSVMEWSKTESTRPKAIQFFKDEFEMNHLLGNLSTPYVVIMDGITMGGGVGLSVHAPFRVATENTMFAMPETKIGYCPDVGSNHFLPRLDGELGTYFALTGTTLKGRAVFELGIATHFIPASRIPDLKDRLASLETSNPDLIDAAIEELHFERSADEPPTPLTGDIRKALDHAFSQITVEDITSSLADYAKNDGEVGQWAKVTLEELHLRSPTSLKVALHAVRRGKAMSLGDVLQMEMGVATAFIHGASPDFQTGVTAVLVDKIKGRPKWSPDTLQEIPDEKITETFFDSNSPLLANIPHLSLRPVQPVSTTNYALPSEKEIEMLVVGEHIASDDMSLNMHELLEKPDRLWKGKHGVKEKLREVFQRRCRMVGATKDTESYIEWIR